MALTLKRPLRGGERGSDVRSVQRALNRWTAGTSADIPASGTFDRTTRDRLAAFQVEQGRRGTGKLGSPTLQLLEPWFTPWLKLTYNAFGTKPKLVEPKQGFESLDESLWEAYSLGRHAGLHDLGTHNPASTLPGGGKSDHAFFPALAFDLGIDPDTGFQHPVGQSYFRRLMGRSEIKYVILGDRIWSRARASEGVRLYTAGGHLNHVHVSGFPDV